MTFAGMGWLLATVTLFLGWRWFTHRTRFPVRAVLLTVFTFWGLFAYREFSLEDYERGAQVLQFFLGPSVVAMAVPLHRNWEKARSNARAIGLAIGSGAAVGIVSVVLLARMFHAPREILVSLAPKSVTSPIGMAITETMGGIPPFAAAAILLVGFFGSEISRVVFPLFRIRREEAQGLALGAAAHGLGSTRAFEISEGAGAMSGLALCLMGIATAVLVPLLLPLLLILF